MGLDLDDDLCNAGLVLGLGTALIHPLSKIKSSLPALVMAAEGSSVEPTLTLGLSAGRDRQGSPPAAYSAVSSFSNACSVKRERDLGGSEVEAEVEERVVSSGGGDDQEEDCSTTRKKLRLTKEQSALLEDSFRQHSTLNPKQKQALARQLNLRARQVEVWFQNRRARTKLKQTEVECEFLKKCCETLTEENRRLQKELQELRAAKLAHQPPLYMQLPAATLTMCPSCERIADAPKGAFTITNAPKRPHFYNLFTNPSAAC